MSQHLRTTSRMVLLLASAVSFIAATAGSAATPEIPDEMAGVWKMNPEKSHWPGSNAPQTLTERIEKQGPRTLRSSFDIGLADGTKRHNDVVRTFDGQEQPVREQSGLTQTCELLDAHRTFRITMKNQGNVVLEMVGQLSADGKTLYIERTQFEQDKKPDSGLVILEKQ